MPTIEMPEMEDWKPTELNGRFSFVCKDSRISESGKGFTLYLTVTDGPKDQKWEGEEIIHYVHTDFADAKEAWQQKQRKSNIYTTCKAFGLNPANFATEDFVGESAVGTVKTKLDREGVLRTNVTSWVIVE